LRELAWKYFCNLRGRPQESDDLVDTTTAQGRLVFNLFASLAEFERDVIRERTQAGLTAARARLAKGGVRKDRR
jgi:DNA invertase Pin-like site-specific DNA recombinase